MYSFCTENLSIFQLSTYRSSELKELAGKIASTHEMHQVNVQARELADYANSNFDFGVCLRAIKGATLISKCERLKSVDFWYQQLTKISSRARESIAVRSLLVGASQPFCSNETFELYIERQQSRGSKALKNLQRNLERAANQSYLMAKAASQKAFADGFLSVFVTLGLDGRYHSSSSAYLGKTFQDGYLELSAALGSILERLSKVGTRGIDFYGLRCVEVHEDGCPHFHILLLIRPDLLPCITEKIRDLHRVHSVEAGMHFEKYEAKILQVRRAEGDWCESYGKAVAYVFKNSYAGRDTDRQKLIGALRQKAVISTYGKHQYEFIGMNGSASVIRELSKRGEVGQVANELGLSGGSEDRRAKWFKAVGALISGGVKKYRLVKESRLNRYGEHVKRTVGVVVRGSSRHGFTGNSIRLSAVICNSSRERRSLPTRAGEYSFADQFYCQSIRAPPNLPWPA
ncbi:replication endonuclease [Pseudomonas anguilliseptica]|uniref:replication endonuclease n=1 Tax=Pseudomonas anguilliseptica TaxID=53406 RepID=UPI001F2FE1A9|nr:replication endonuclease [Pseudomonas anguilliseptica]MCE5364208.1 replication endonuclease [Pseudomonas anguilliseptica]